MLVRVWRSTVGRFGAVARQHRIDSLGRALIDRQQTNGCWSWTALGTSTALLALRAIQDVASLEVDHALSYLNSLRCESPNSGVALSWAAGAVWDTARAGEILLLSSDWTPQQALTLAQSLVSQIHDDGLTSFDVGVKLGDHDSSAAVLTFLSKTYTLMERDAPSWLGGAIEHVVEGLLAGQCSDGGWGALATRVQVNAKPR